MNVSTSLRIVVVAGLALVAPTKVLARDHGHSHSSHGGGGYYVSHGYRGGFYGYRSYRPYYGRPYYYGGPSISLGFSTAPDYYYGGSYYDSYPTRTVYRGAPVSRSYASYEDDLAVDVQRALSRRGFYRGGIDGDVGPGTRAAIRSYQYNRGLEVTGRIDGSLLRSLGLS